MAESIQEPGLFGPAGNEIDGSRYSVCFICPLSLERRAVCSMLDKQDEEINFLTPDGKHYLFQTGRLGDHDVVVADFGTGEIGQVAAASLRAHMPWKFRDIQLYFLVGVAGGMPDDRHDIRLGDVVIANKVVKYDEGKWLDERKLEQTGEQFRAPPILFRQLDKFFDPARDNGSILNEHLDYMKRRCPGSADQFEYPGPEKDILFDASFPHDKDADLNEECRICREKAIQEDKLKNRTPREDQKPKVFTGMVVSGDAVVRNGQVRQELKDNNKEALAVEMEAAGSTPERTIVVRGICDYADTHKNNRFRGYAAANAAACAKELLNFMAADFQFGKPNLVQAS